MRTLDDILSDQMKDVRFRKEYEAIHPEMDVIRAKSNCIIIHKLRAGKSEGSQTGSVNKKKC